MYKKKLIPITIIFSCMVLNAFSQKSTSLSLNYQYLSEAGNHGIGIGFKTSLWKDVVLLSDANYFFKNYHGIFEEKSQKEYYTRYAALNLNIGYNIVLSEKFNLIPFAGLGVFYQNNDGYIYIEGGGSWYNSPYTSVSIDENYTAPLANIGLLAEYYLSEHIFINGGIKGQIDIYDGTQNDFPCFTLGGGYRF
jgi:hypothetical protein